MRAFIFFLVVSICSTASAAECSSLPVLYKYKPRYSNAFSIDYYSDFRILKVDGDSLVLKKKGVTLNCNTSTYVIETPVKRVVMTSTTQLPALIMLAQENSLIGFQNKKYIYSDHFLKDQITNISFPLVPEELLSLKANLIMFYDLSATGKKTQVQLRKLNLPVVFNNDYKEKSALARAEWLIYISSFYNQEEKATKIFKDIERKYNDVKSKAVGIKNKKNILVGEIQAGKWVTCGGLSDLGQLIRDAGGELVFNSSESKTQNISLEELFSQPPNINIWLTQNNWIERNEINKDTRYKNLKDIPIYNYQLRVNALGANDYWEMGMARPDIMLEEYAAIFYPEIFTKHELVWYKKI